jgi:hypothetical protein
MNIDTRDTDMPELSDLFAAKKSNVIEWHGVLTYGLYEFEEVPRRIILEFISAKAEPAQGIQLRVRGGTMSIDDSVSDNFVLWQKGAPDRVEIEICTETQRKPSLKLWNVWQGGLNVTQAWLRNAAIRVEGQPSGRIILRCSDGQGEADFEDLVVAVTPQ